MAQPSDPLFPASYDDEISLLGLPGNREVFTVAAVISVDDIIFQMVEDVTSVELPCYITFEGGEIIYITSVLGSNSFECDTLGDRGALSTSIQPHGANELVYITILSANHNITRAAVILAQKYQGKVGLDAYKGDYPVVGEAYVATDTDKIYRCFEDDYWVQINYRSHGDLANLDGHHHTQYHIDSYATATWHPAQSGDHINSGNDHDHHSSGEGSAVVRVDGGLDANRPTGMVDGQIYFATDLDGGTLHVGQGGAWSKIGGVPQGGIMAFESACPGGWTRYAKLDDAYPRGGPPTEAGTEGGSWTHVHGYSAIREHYHTVGSVGGVTSTSSGQGNHFNEAWDGSGGGQSRDCYSSDVAGGNPTTDGGDHGHTLTTSGHNTENAGLGSGAETNAGTNKPESYRIMWCEKD